MLRRDAASQADAAATDPWNQSLGHNHAQRFHQRIGAFGAFGRFENADHTTDGGGDADDALGGHPRQADPAEAARAPREADVVYAAAGRNGLWRSSDAGVTWARLRGAGHPEPAGPVRRALHRA